MDFPDSNYFDRAWQQARQSASLCRREKDPAAWQAFWELFAPTYLKICKALMPTVRQAIVNWKENGLVDKLSRVLDIGCGPGTYTLPLGEVAGEVMAMDTAANMLCVLDEEAQRQGLDNIRLIQADWVDAVVQKEYDLVFAANSPAIKDLHTLLKMNDASRNACMLICYAGQGTPTLRNLLWERIMGEKLQGNTFDISYPFNILCREGFSPHVSFQEQGYSYLESVVAVMENYRAYFRIFGKEGPAVERVLRQSVQNCSVNGLVQENVSYRQAVMWWTVHP